MTVLQLEDIVEGDHYTLCFIEGFGSKMTLYSNATCYMKSDNGAGFTTFADGYMFIEKDRIPVEVRSHLLSLTFEGDE